MADVTGQFWLVAKAFYSQIWVLALRLAKAEADVF